MHSRSVHRPLGDLARKVNDQVKATQADAATARGKLAELVPQLPERLSELANELNEQADQNRQLARDAQSDVKKAPAVARSASEMADRNKQTSNRLGNLQDDLRREANSRDLAG